MDSFISGTQDLGKIGIYTGMFGIILVMIFSVVVYNVYAEGARQTKQEKPSMIPLILWELFLIGVFVMMYLTRNNKTLQTVSGVSGEFDLLKSLFQ
jgi:di/tricarboxylate transporter